MQVKLFLAPYVDEEGLSRQHLCAAVVGAGPVDESLQQFAHDLRTALDTGVRVVIFDGSTDVSWL